MKKRAFLATGSLILWHKPLVESLVLPAHAQTSVLLAMVILDVLMRDDGSLMGFQTSVCAPISSGELEFDINLRDGSVVTYVVPYAFQTSVPTGVSVLIADMVSVDAAYRDHAGELNTTFSEADILAVTNDTTVIETGICPINRS